MTKDSPMSESLRPIEEYTSTVMVKGLKAALRDSSIETSLAKVQDGHIKLNKLMFMGAEEYDLLDDLQHSWHIYGSDMGNLVPATRSVTATPFDALPTTELPESPAIEEATGNVVSEEEFYQYYQNISLGPLESLEEIIRAERVDLLEAFYDQYADEVPGFASLYEDNVDLQRVLDHDEENGDIENIDETRYNEVNEICRKIRNKFRDHEAFGYYALDNLDVDVSIDIRDDFIDFLQLVDDVYFNISQQAESQIDGEVQYIIGQLNSFYHEYAWKTVTEIISLQTVKGPNRESLQYGAREELQTLDSNYKIRYRRLISECENAGVFSDSPGEKDSGVMTPDESLDLLESSDLLSS